MIKLETIIKHIPGMRIIKTSVALLLCVLFGYFFRDGQTPYQAGIVAIVCMQRGMSTTIQSSANRAIGTVVSGLYAYLFLLWTLQTMHLDPTDFAYNVLVVLAVIPLMYFMVKIKMKGAVAITTIIFVIICFTTGNQDPLGYTIVRVTDTLIGIAAALFVEWFPPFNKLGLWMREVGHLEYPDELMKSLGHK